MLNKARENGALLVAAAVASTYVAKLTDQRSAATSAWAC
jgi:hypothetical protein